MTTTSPAQTESGRIGWIRFAFYCPCDGLKTILYGQYPDEYLDGFIEAFMELHDGHRFRIAEYPERIEK